MSKMIVSSKKRKQFSIAEKLSVIDQLQAGIPRSTLCQQYGIAESTLRGWIKEEDKLRAIGRSMDESGPGPDRKRIRGAKDMELDQAVNTWCKQAQAEGIPISGPEIRDQARKFHSLMHPEDESFNSSSGWLRNFKRRHSIRLAGNHKEEPSERELEKNYPIHFSNIIIDGCYTADQVYNCTETALYYKILPSTTLVIKDEILMTLGVKQENNRLTALLCTNSTGRHKLKPLILGKFENPCPLNDVSEDTLPTHYSHSRNALLTSTLFEEWFHNNFVPEVKAHLCKQQLEPKAVLLVDSSAAHPVNLTSKCGSIKLSAQPKNLAYKIQPLDMGIIATTKRNYRRDLVLAIINSDLNLIEFVDQLNIKEALNLFVKAWEEVTPERINACWEKALGNALPGAQNSNVALNSFSEDNKKQSECCSTEEFSVADMMIACQAFGDVSSEEINAWLRVDNDDPTSDTMTDEEIIAQARSAANQAIKMEEEAVVEAKEEPEYEDTEPLPSMKEVVKGLETGLRWLMKSKYGTVKDVMHLTDIIRKAKKES